MVDTLYDNHYKSREKLAWEFAKILNEEARELQDAGVDIIQFDEPAFNVFFDQVNDWCMVALEKAIEGLNCDTAIHICYGYGIKANTDWKKTLGSEWLQYEKIFPKIQKSTIDTVSLFKATYTVSPRAATNNFAATFMIRECPLPHVTSHIVKT